MMLDFSHELKAALGAAARAADYLRSAYQSFEKMDDAPVSISTEADKNSQEIILKYLHNLFPNDQLCGEETTESLASATASSSGRTWVVDPIDGTRGFVTKNGEFSIMIGLRIGQEIVAGVVSEPALDRVTLAEKNRGCWFTIGPGQPQSARVSNIGHIAQGRLVQSHAKKGTQSPMQLALAPKQLLETYSAGVKMALVARGEAEIYVNTYPKFKDWDICAGHILVTEAGGIVAGIRGESVVYGKDDFRQELGLVANNGLVHHDCLQKLQLVPLG